MYRIIVKTTARDQLVDITREVSKTVEDSGVEHGLAVVFSPHTTAAITVNENADPSVVQDFLTHFEKMVPQNAGYEHFEGNSDSHIKSSLIGCSETIIIHNGKLQLGTWQSIYFCEFDGPRSRQVWIKVLG